MLKCYIPCPDDPNPRRCVSQRESHHSLSAQSEHKDRIVEPLGYGWVSSRATNDPIEYLVDDICHHVRRLSVFCSLRCVTDRLECVDWYLLEATLTKFEVLFEIDRAIWIGKTSDCTHPEISARISGVNPIHPHFCLIEVSTCPNWLQVWVAQVFARRIIAVPLIL